MFAVVSALIVLGKHAKGLILLFNELRHDVAGYVVCVRAPDFHHFMDLHVFYDCLRINLKFFFIISSVFHALRQSHISGLVYDPHSRSLRI